MTTEPEKSWKKVTEMRVEMDGVSHTFPKGRIRIGKNPVPLTDKPGGEVIGEVVLSTDAHGNIIGTASVDPESAWGKMFKSDPSDFSMYMPPPIPWENRSQCEGEG